MQETEKNAIFTNVDTWDNNPQARMWQTGTLGIVLIFLRRLWIEVCLFFPYKYIVIYTDSS